MKSGDFRSALIALLLSPVLATGDETITVDGATYEGAEMVEAAPDGAIYRTAEGEHVVLPWKDLSSAQLSALEEKFPEALDNAIHGAWWVKGTVFQVNRDGVVIQVSIPEDKGGPPARNGCVVPTSGLVLVKDLPTNIPQGEGAEIEIVAHKRQTYTYDMGIAAKEIPLLTVARPLWGQEQEWINADGQKMYARLVAVKEGRGLFEKGGETFVYELSKLDAEGQERAAEIAKKLEPFPVP